MVERAVGMITQCRCLLGPTLFLCGCGQKRMFLTYMRSDWLYLKDQPYARLHVAMRDIPWRVCRPVS